MAYGNGPPSRAARLYAATRAVLDDNGKPSFGVRIVQPGEPSLVDRTTAAYNDPSAYPLPNPANWLSQLANVDPKTLPKSVGNWLMNFASSTVQDPMSAAMPFPLIGRGAKGMRAMQAARAAEAVRVAEAARVAEMGELGQRMKGVNQYLAQRKTPFAAGLDPLPSRVAPIKQYVTENVGPRQVNVTGEIVHAPERITPEQARAAGVTGPVPYETPQFRFTRQGPRAEIHNAAAADLSGSAAAAKLPPTPAALAPPRIKGSSDLVDGLRVGKTVSNTSSISSSLDKWQELPGIRRIPFSAFEEHGPVKFPSARAKDLAEQITKSNRIDPLIVVQDAKGYYVLEGSNRYDALRVLGKKEMPAMVVRDLSEVPRLRRKK